MPSLELFCEISATLGAKMLGKMPGGTRVDFPFEGVATSPHWDGERPVLGIDYTTVRGDGAMDLDIRGVIGEKREQVAYRGGGVSLPVSETEAHPRELITFQTGNEDLGWLNQAIGIGLGRGASGRIDLSIYIVRD